MANITFEEMPKSAQEAYLKKVKLRKILIPLGWAVAALFFVSSFIGGIVGAVSGNGVSWIVEGIFGGLIYGVVFGGFGLGFSHWGHLFKKALKNGIGLVIILGIWYIIIFALIAALAMLTGWFFLIIDSIKFITKKPLISQAEMKRLLQTEQAQNEMLAQAIGEMNAPSAAEKLQELKDMLDGGLITEAEFSSKKEELLRNL